MDAVRWARIQYKARLLAPPKKRLSVRKLTPINPKDPVYMYLNPPTLTFNLSGNQDFSGHVLVKCPMTNLVFHLSRFTDTQLAFTINYGIPPKEAPFANPVKSALPGLKNLLGDLLTKLKISRGTRIFNLL